MYFPSGAGGSVDDVEKRSARTKRPRLNLPVRWAACAGCLRQGTVATILARGWHVRKRRCLHPPPVGVAFLQCTIGAPQRLKDHGVHNPHFARYTIMCGSGHRRAAPRATVDGVRMSSCRWRGAHLCCSLGRRRSRRQYIAHQHGRPPWEDPAVRGLSPSP